MSDETKPAGTAAPDEYDYGPLQTYEVTWTSGHVEKIRCHQISYSGTALDLFAAYRPKQPERRIHLHGMIDGRWLLVLSAREADIVSLRLVTGGEEFAGESFTFDAPGGEGRD